MASYRVLKFRHSHAGNIHRLFWPGFPNSCKRKWRIWSKRTSQCNETCLSLKVLETRFPLIFLMTQKWVLGIMLSSGKMCSWCAVLPHDLVHTGFWEPQTHVRVYTDYPHPNWPGILWQLTHDLDAPLLYLVLPFYLCICYINQVENQGVLESALYPFSITIQWHMGT